MTGPVAFLARLSVATAFAVFCWCTPASAQPADITGDAILRHPAGQLAVKAAELLTAGKTEEVVALGPKSGRDEWRKASAADRKGMAEMMQKRAPAPAMYSEAIPKSGALGSWGIRPSSEWTLPRAMR